MKKKIIILLILVLLLTITFVVFEFNLISKFRKPQSTQKQEFPAMKINKNGAINNPSKEDLKNLIKEVKSQNSNIQKEE